MTSARSWLLAAAALVWLSPTQIQAQELHSSPNQFGDVQPTDWAYQALDNLNQNYGCFAGYPGGSLRGNQPISRDEAAALLKACLEHTTEITDQLRRLINEFAAELAIQRGRVDGLEARVGELDATAFSTTTTLEGSLNFVIGANRFLGSAGRLVRQNNREFGATSFNTNLVLQLNTSFTGKDLLFTELRSGTLGPRTSFGGGGPSNQSWLDVAYDSTTENESIRLDIARLYTVVPFSDTVNLIAGPRVAQNEMLAINPSLYASDPILNVASMGGAPLALNQNEGAGAGISWEPLPGIYVSANYIAIMGADGNSSTGGIATNHAGGAGSLQLGYQDGPWTLAATYSGLQHGEAQDPYATPRFVQTIQDNPGFTHAFGLGGSWQPADSGWIPTISAGWGINRSNYDSGVERQGLAQISQSWTLGLEWNDALVPGNNAGMAVGQPVFITSQYGGGTPDDGNFIWEWWYQFQLTDAISITPALFYLSRPSGENTPVGKRFSQMGGLVLTSFKF